MYPAIVSTYNLLRRAAEVVAETETREDLKLMANRYINLLDAEKKIPGRIVDSEQYGGVPPPVKALHARKRNLACECLGCNPMRGLWRQRDIRLQHVMASYGVPRYPTCNCKAMDDSAV